MYKGIKEIYALPIHAERFLRNLEKHGFSITIEEIPCYCLGYCGGEAPGYVEMLEERIGIAMKNKNRVDVSYKWLSLSPAMGIVLLEYQLEIPEEWLLAFFCESIKEVEVERCRKT